MNYIDIAVIIILALYILIGVYEGFLQGIINVLCFFGTWVLSALIYPLFARYLKGIGWIFDTLRFYMEGAERLPGVETARMIVSDMNIEQIDSIIAQSTLPHPLGKLVRENVAAEVFAPVNATALGEYVNLTIVHFAINLIAFLAVFMVIRLAFALVLKCVDYVKPLPVLSHFDSVLGGGMGLIRAFFTLFLVFMIVPLILVMLPASGGVNSTMVSDYVASSFFGPFFYRFNFLFGAIGGG